MIKTTVDRLTPVDLFDVEELIQVYDRTSALLIEHIFNHLKVLSVLDMEVADNGLYAICEHYYGWLPDSSGYNPPFAATRAQIADEIEQLVGLLSQRDASRKDRAAAYEALNIPFLDFDYRQQSLAVPLALPDTTM